MSASRNVVGNVYDKYGTKNRVARALMRGFLGAVTQLYSRAAPHSVLEVGCGEGELAAHLLREAKRPARFVVTDIDLGSLAPGLDPMIETRQASVYELPFADASFDVVLCCEVLEHLDEPERGFAEVARVAGRAAIVSAPREPLWRVLNVLRGSYLRDLGNTPGHVQHFGHRSLLRLVDKYMRVVEVRHPVPWTMLLAEKRVA
jgi:ubiquinone/menaquinone biosynthesis C-methylase UbiE